jgi:CelD/BcsL family acetyltransferase involved in cellulose biosynthesis
MTSEITATILSGFDDPRCTPEQWNTLLQRGDTDAVFLTWEYQRAWWDSFERTGLLLIAAERDGELAAIAPFFAEEGMVYFIGSGGSDYLDFIGDVTAHGVLRALLEAAREQVSGFVGFVFYHVPGSSRTGVLIEHVAQEIGMRVVIQDSMLAPFLDIAGNPEAAQAVADKKGPVQSERTLRRDGTLEIEHLRDGHTIVAHLPEFIQQHIERWALTPSPSQFHRAAERKFFERLSIAAADTGWLRFTRVSWNGTLIACHFGFSYEGTYYFYKPTFNLRFAKRSPGQVLLRNVLIAALEEQTRTFDLGLGDEEFKMRFATGTRQVQNWALHRAEMPLPELW